MYYPVFLLIILVSGMVIEIVFKEHLFHSLKERILCIVIAVIAITVWDFYGIPREHWIFTGPGMTGINILKLPLDLYLFYIILPYFVFVLFELIHKKMDKEKQK